MIPGNHSASLVIISNEFSYLGQARECDGDWEVFCHHGAGHGVGADSLKITAALRGMRDLDGTKFYDTSGNQIAPTWRLFYWCNRYCLSATAGGGAKLVERFRFLHGKRRTVLEF